MEVLTLERIDVSDETVFLVNNRIIDNKVNIGAYSILKILVNTFREYIILFINSFARGIDFDFVYNYFVIIYRISSIQTSL